MLQWGNTVCRPRGEAAKLVLFARVEFHRTNGIVPKLPLRSIFLESYHCLRKLSQKSRLLAPRISPAKTREEGYVQVLLCTSRPHLILRLHRSSCSFLLPLEHETRGFCLSARRQRPSTTSQHVGAPLPAGVLFSSGSGSGP